MHTRDQIGIPFHDMLRELDGRVSYRQLDYWARTGAITLRHGAEGSGSRRMVMPDERLAIFALVEHYEMVQADLERLRSGELFQQLLGWNHDVAEAS